MEQRDDGRSEVVEEERIRFLSFVYHKAILKVRKHLSISSRLCKSMQECAHPKGLEQAKHCTDKLEAELSKAIGLLLNPDTTGYDAAVLPDRDFTSQCFLFPGRTREDAGFLPAHPAVVRAQDQRVMKRDYDDFLAQLTAGKHAGIRTDDIILALESDHGYTAKKFAGFMHILIESVFGEAKDGTRKGSLMQQERILKMMLETIRSREPKVELHAHSHEQVGDMTTEDLEAVLTTAFKNKNGDE